MLSYVNFAEKLINNFFDRNTFIFIFDVASCPISMYPKITDKPFGYFFFIHSISLLISSAISLIVAAPVW